MFQKNGPGRVCFNCQELEEQAYRLVRDFLEANPGSTIPTVAEGTGLDEAMIIRLLNEGRLVALGDLTSGLKIECRRCGAPTSSGKFCAVCTEQIGQELKSSAASLLDKPDPTRLRRPETIQEKHGGHSSSRHDRR
jgi:hypothetical protein